VLAISARTWRTAAAFATGGVRDIGFSLGRALAEAVMKTMLASLETD